VLGTETAVCQGERQQIRITEVMTQTITERVSLPLVDQF
jgi:hypothetical protein